MELVTADLADPESLPPALKDVDFVVHAAAQLGDWGPPDRFRRINVYALEHMLNAAHREGRLRRWVQISSLGVYAARHHYGTDETTPPDLAGLDGYTRTKAEAEVVLKRYLDEYQFPGVILRPGFMYGPWDRTVVPKVVESLAKGQMKYIGDGKKVINNTYVGNLADAIMLALDCERAVGETYNIRDERLVTRQEFITTVADYIGRPHPSSVPEWLARTAVGPIEWFARVRGSETAPLLTRARLKFMALNLDFSIAKAKQQLGYAPRVDFRDGIRETLDWAVQHHLVPGMTSPPSG